MTVKSYLRAIVRRKEKCLALFDSNREGDINNLFTDVPSGGTIIWKPDCCSGIKKIVRIIPEKADVHPVFKSNPKKLLLCRGFIYRLEKGAEGEEKYTIECILCNNTKLTVDPFIRIPPVR